MHGNVIGCGWGGGTEVKVVTIVTDCEMPVAPLCGRIESEKFYNTRTMTTSQCFYMPLAITTTTITTTTTMAEEVQKDDGNNNKSPTNDCSSINNQVIESEISARRQTTAAVRDTQIQRIKMTGRNVNS